MRKCAVVAVIAVIAVLLALSVSPARAASPVRVYYAGPEGRVRSALGLAPEFEFVGDPAQADVLVLNDAVPGGPGGTAAALLRRGTGAVLFQGPHATLADLGFPERVTPAPSGTPVSLVPRPDLHDPLLDGIVWTSAPQVRERYPLAGDWKQGALVTGFEDGETLLGVLEPGGTLYVFAPFLDGANPQFQDWAYFNYLVYHLTMRAAGRVPVSFADYPGSPVPHAAERAFLFAALAVMVLIAFAAFWWVRRYSLRHPEALEHLVADRAEYAAREQNTAWNEVGFHRPLGGFLLALLLGLVLFIPLIIYQNIILPVYILPSAQALGIWGRVVQFFNLLWTLFDMGTSAAFIKFFSQYRVHDPKRGIQYAQVFVWWQALSGALQVAAVTVVAGTLLPQTIYALYAWSVIVHTLIQIPGFYQIMRHALMAWQRFDYAQILEVGLYLVFPILAQPLIVTLFVTWGTAHPVFGMATGGLIGLGLAAYAAEALTFVLGLWLYRRLGYSARVLFMAHFDWQTVKSAFRFGVFEMLGSAAWAIGQAAEILVTQTRLINYAEVWGNWGLAQNFVFAFNAQMTLYNELMPSMSEAVSHARLALSKYYSAMAYKWGGFISAFLGSVLLAVADRFILGASGPEFARAASYAIPLILWGAIQYPSWIGDNVQRAANRPALITVMVSLEQVVRIGLAWVLLERFQVNALIVAYFVGLLLKDVAAYFVNDRLCFPQKFYFWQSLGAPLLAGAAHYTVLRYATGLIWQGDQVTSVVIFFVGILLSYPLFTFFYGLFGGWDDATLGEVRQAIPLSSFMRPLAWLFWWSSAQGARVSPLHGRFPIDVRPAAMDEARSLTDERVGV